MKIDNFGSNQTQISMNNGTEILVSYSTPVAAFIPGQGYVRTEKFWSVTTSKHINRWLNGRKAKSVSQEMLNDLMK